MAILTSDQLTEIRQRLQSSNQASVSAVKGQINAAAQAVEDYYETTARAGMSAAIEAAAPGVFTNAQKRKIAKFWLQQKAERE